MHHSFCFILGDARLALEVFRGSLQVDGAVFAQARARMESPTPRVALGLALRGLASACADVSDGLLGDLGHILKASRLGARIDVDAAAACMALGAAVSPAQRRACALAGGDDYELVFTAAATQRAAVEAAAAQAGVAVSRIGSTEAQAGLRLVDAAGQAVDERYASFDHFA